MPRQDKPVSVPGQSANEGQKRRQGDGQAGRSTEAPEKPSGTGRSGANTSPSAGDPQLPNDPVDEPPAETATDDPDSNSDTILTPGSPSEYDRQRDARPDRVGDNWSTGR